MHRMSRTNRLLDLIQLLRRHKRPVIGAVLADELGISLRTLYRDIATLQAQGAHVDGEPGLGYVLRPGFMLPPLMFSEEEIEAIVLGSRWVAERADKRLGMAAKNALAKIGSVLPPDLREAIDSSGLMVPPCLPSGVGDEELATARQAIRTERKLSMTYRDAKDDSTTRTIWPIAVAFFDNMRIIAAWCELRGEYRHFRVDRIVKLHMLDDKYPRRRRVLTKEWRRLHDFPER
jgi:predicted DNA-binding transcriptional regulator YafY